VLVTNGNPAPRLRSETLLDGVRVIKVD
jgi:hypothetical protein